MLITDLAFPQSSLHQHKAHSNRRAILRTWREHTPWRRTADHCFSRKYFFWVCICSCVCTCLYIIKLYWLWYTGAHLPDPPHLSDSNVNRRLHCGLPRYRGRQVEEGCRRVCQLWHRVRGHCHRRGHLCQVPLALWPQEGPRLCHDRPSVVQGEAFESFRIHVKHIFKTFWTGSSPRLLSIQRLQPMLGSSRSLLWVVQSREQVQVRLGQDYVWEMWLERQSLFWRRCYTKKEAFKGLGQKPQCSTGVRGWTIAPLSTKNAKGRQWALPSIAHACLHWIAHSGLWLFTLDADVLHSRSLGGCRSSKFWLQA